MRREVTGALALRARASRVELSQVLAVGLCWLVANGRDPDGRADEKRDLGLGAGTLIAVSVFSSMAFIIANAIH
jgi:hypothetical protein